MRLSATIMALGHFCSHCTSSNEISGRSLPHGWLTRNRFQGPIVHSPPLRQSKTRSNLQIIVHCWDLMESPWGRMEAGGSFQSFYFNTKSSNFQSICELWIGRAIEEPVFSRVDKGIRLFAWKWKLGGFILIFWICSFDCFYLQYLIRSRLTWKCSSKCK